MELKKPLSHRNIRILNRYKLRNKNNLKKMRIVKNFLNKRFDKFFSKYVFNIISKYVRVDSKINYYINHIHENIKKHDLLRIVLPSRPDAHF